MPTSFLELKWHPMTWRAISVRPYNVLRRIHCTRVLSYTESYDVAGSICQALPAPRRAVTRKRELRRRPPHRSGHGSPAVRGLHSSTFRLIVSSSSSTDTFQPSFNELEHTLGGVSDRNVSG